MDTEIKCGQKWVVFGRDYCRKELVLFFKEIIQERPLGFYIAAFGIRKFIFTAEAQRAQRKTTEAIFTF